MRVLSDDTGSSAREALGRARSAVAERTPSQVRTAWGWFFGDAFFTSAASLAFYALISIPPMIIIALALADVALGGDTLRTTTQELVDQAPDQFQLGGVLNGLVETAGRVGWLSVAAAVWPATAYGAALAKGFDVVTPDAKAEREVQGWKGRLLALVVVGLLPLVVFAAVAVVYVVPRLLDTSGVVLELLLGAAALGIFFLIVLLIFFLFHVQDQSLRNLALGAAAATGGQAVLTGGYLLYLSLGANFEKTYGSSALAVVVLLGLYLLLSNGSLLSAYRYALARDRPDLAQERDAPDAPAGTR